MRRAVLVLIVVLSTYPGQMEVCALHVLDCEGATCTYGSLDEVTARISVVSSVPLPAFISLYCQILNTNAKLDIHLRFHDSDVVCR